MTQHSQQHDDYTLNKDNDGLPIIEVHNRLGQARIALQGAHVLSYQAHGQQPLLWLSPDAVFAQGKSIRGGVPVCWPWFGAHPNDQTKPAHGFARNHDWKVSASKSLDDGSTLLVLRLQDSAWSSDFPLSLDMHITVGSHLSLELRSTNLGEQTFPLSQALHSYFVVADVRQVQLVGLHGCAYYDKLQDFKQCKQDGNVQVIHEVDRVYVATPKHLRLDDPSMQRSIHLQAWGSRSTVVWNPWQDTAQAMGDMGQDGYQQMLCVETANAFDDIIQLAPHAEHRMGVRYTTTPLQQAEPA